MKTASSPDKLDQTFNFFLFDDKFEQKIGQNFNSPASEEVRRYSLSSVSVPKVQTEDGANTQNPNEQSEETEKEDGFDKIVFVRKADIFFLIHWSCAFNHLFLRLRLTHKNN